MLDLVEQYRPLREAMLGVVSAALDSGRFVMGPDVTAFETEIAALVGTRHAVACASGSDALLLACMALDVGPGDAVITTPYSFFSTVSCITRVGARPLLVDIEPDTMNLDMAAVRRLLTDECELRDGVPVHRATETRVRAVIPVHLFGQCADMDALQAVCDEFGLAVVEDAAQTLGGRWGNGAAGALGTLGCFSFYPAKNLGALGDGGIITTSDDAHAEKLRKLRVHGAKPKYVHQYVGLNSRLDAIQAGFLRVLLPKLSAWSDARRQHAQAYDEALAETDGIQTPVARPDAYHVYNQYVIRSARRDALRDFLMSKGVQTEIYYPVPLHVQECFADLGYTRGDFPVSERTAEESLALPVGPTLTAEQQGTVVAALQEVAA